MFQGSPLLDDQSTGATAAMIVSLQRLKPRHLQVRKGTSQIVTGKIDTRNVRSVARESFPDREVAGFGGSIPLAGSPKITVGCVVQSNQRFLLIRRSQRTQTGHRRHQSEESKPPPQHGKEKMRMAARLDRSNQLRLVRSCTSQKWVYSIPLGQGRFANNPISNHNRINCTDSF